MRTYEETYSKVVEDMEELLSLRNVEVDTKVLVQWEGIYTFLGYLNGENPRHKTNLEQWYRHIGFRQERSADDPEYVLSRGAVWSRLKIRNGQAHEIRVRVIEDGALASVLLDKYKDALNTIEAAGKARARVFEMAVDSVRDMEYILGTPPLVGDLVSVFVGGTLSCFLIKSRMVHPGGPDEGPAHGVITYFLSYQGPYDFTNQTPFGI